MCRLLGVVVSMTAFVAAGAIAQAQSTWFVDDDASGGDGTSWVTAFDELQAALAAAKPGDEIKIAAGIYRPDYDVKTGLHTGDREATFALASGVALLGGFAGVTEPDPGVRDVEVYETILSGDLSGDDGPEFLNSEENSYHVVTALNVDDTAVLDGCTVSGGRADGPNFGASPDSQNQGSAVNVYYASPHLLDCTFRDNWVLNHGTVNDHGNTTLIGCTFRQNYADNLGAGLYSHFEVMTTAVDCEFIENVTPGNGGGAYNKGSRLVTYTNCTFEGNSAELGGGMYNAQGSASTLLGCSFVGNTALAGGGFYGKQADPTLTQCVFIGNGGLGEAGGSSGGGGMWNEGGHPVVTNCSFIDNIGFDGGGMYNGNFSLATISDCLFSGNSAFNENGGGLSNVESDAIISGCTFVGNSVQGSEFAVGGGMSSYLSAPTVTDCIFIDNTASFGGGGMYTESGDAVPDISRCVFSGNQAGRGAGMYNFFSNPMVSSCLFEQNIAGGGRDNPGGGMYNSFAASPTVNNCTFVANSSERGGGMSNENIVSGTLVTNCIFWGNTPDQVNDDGFMPTSVNFTDIQGGWSGEGSNNLDTDPLFVEPATSDYHLSPDSPCIDIGDNSVVGPEDTDIDDQPRIGNAVVDLGADEFHAGCAADLNGDGQVNATDLAILLGAWGGDQTEESDFNGDGVVDAADLAFLLGNWGRC